MKWPWQKSYSIPEPEGYAEVKTDITVDQALRLVSMVEETFNLTVLHLQATTMLLAHTNDKHNVEVANNCIAEVCNAIGRVYGKEVATKLLDTYTKGQYSIVKELEGAGMSEDQILAFMDKKGKFDA